MKNSVLQSIPFRRAISTSGDTLFGHWYDYDWAIERSNQNEKDAINLEKLVAKIINIQIGVIPCTGGVQLRDQYKEVNNSNAIANGDRVFFEVV